MKRSHKDTGWGENPPPSSPGGGASSSPAEMELQHPDVVFFGTHAVGWDMMTSLATQSLCQACSFGAWDKFSI